MKYLTKCPICDNTDVKTIHHRLKDRLFEENQEEFCLQNCPDCGSVYTNPQIELSEFHKFYPTDAYVPYQPSSIKKYQIFSKMLYDVFTRLFINKLRGTITPGFKILEIGCSNGEFLLKCKNHGMEAIGVEPDRNAARSALQQGLNVIVLPFEKAYQQIKDQKFDIIFMSHVFEHLQNPKQVLINLRNLLKDDGKIVIIVPNRNSINYRFFKQHWMALDIPRHIFHYSPESINYIAMLSDLAIEEIRFISGPISFLNSIRYSLNIKNLKINNKYTLKILALPIVILFNVIKKGDEIAIYIRKK